MWKNELERLLPLLGHRNWILIVDKSFPLQGNSSIKLLNTEEPLLDVLSYTLKKIADASHLKPVVYLDKELDYMTNDLVMDVDLLRQEIKKKILLTPDSELRTVPHDDIFVKLDTAAQLFQVVVLKTESLIPYTSAFIELDCGYWTTDQEKRLRDRMTE